MNLFDGQQGRSNGTKDGTSSTLPSGIRSIAVHGAWDGAKVTIQRYSKEIDDWFSTQASWTDNDVFQGLDAESGARYRLIITGATSKTKLIAEF
jgi:hypothetical protein